MDARILCVDDDRNVLSAYQRHLRKDFRIEAALGPEEGLEAVEKTGPYAVVVSDLKMPGMNGIEFLSRVKEIAPDTVRIMLTGFADMGSAIEAVNQGNIFRFLSKPCPPAAMSQALNEGVRQYRLVTAEHELLEKTLRGSIAVLTEILSLADPQSFGRGRKLAEEVRGLAGILEVPAPWELEMAAMLSQVGYVAIPQAIIIKELSGGGLNEPERDMLRRVPEIGHNLLNRIPRLEPVARAVLYQQKNYDGTGFPEDPVAGERIPLVARILRILADKVALQSEGKSKAAVRSALRDRTGSYDPAILEAVFSSMDRPARFIEAERRILSLPVRELEVGQILASDVVTRGGSLLIASGHGISETVLERIRNFARVTGIMEPIRVEVLEPLGPPPGSIAANPLLERQV